MTSILPFRSVLRLRILDDVDVESTGIRMLFQMAGLALAAEFPDLKRRLFVGREDIRSGYAFRLHCRNTHRPEKAPHNCKSCAIFVAYSGTSFSSSSRASSSADAAAQQSLLQIM